VQPLSLIQDDLSLDGVTPRQDFWTKDHPKTPRIYDI
jgi:hypothetical protein